MESLFLLEDIMVDFVVDNVVICYFYPLPASTVKVVLDGSGCADRWRSFFLFADVDFAC